MFLAVSQLAPKRQKAQRTRSLTRLDFYTNIGEIPKFITLVPIFLFFVVLTFDALLLSGNPVGNCYPFVLINLNTDTAKFLLFILPFGLGRRVVAAALVVSGVRLVVVVVLCVVLCVVVVVVVVVVTWFPWGLVCSWICPLLIDAWIPDWSKKPPMAPRIPSMGRLPWLLLLLLLLLFCCCWGGLPRPPRIWPKSIRTSSGEKRV